MNRKIITPEAVHKPTTYYSHAVVVDDIIVYTAGQAPHDQTGAVWPRVDTAGQIHRVFNNLNEVLKASGVDFGDIARLTLLTCRPDVIPVFWKVAPTYLGSHRPAMTIAVVKGLAGREYLLELEAIAYK